VKEGEIKKLEKFAPVEAGEIPFAIPSGWQIIRMGWLARKLGAGSTPLGGKTVYQSEGVPFLRSQNVYNNGLRLDDVALIPRAVHERMSGTHVQQHDVLLNITGASIGRCALVPSSFTEGNVSQHVAIIRLFAPEIRTFVHLSLTSPFFQKLIDDVQVGVSREGLSMQRLKFFPMPLPPLAEQHRIVAKVDELMALCDQLEAAKTEREQSRDRLVAASLHRLNQPADAEEANPPEAFRDHARFYFNHLLRLTTRPEHIKQLRQTILNLAVRGKLVPQDPNDEPAGELLNRVAAERQELIAKGRLKAPKSCTTINADPPSQPIPATWKWMRLADLISFGPQNGISPKPTNNTESPKALTLTATTSGIFNASYYKHVDLREVDCQNYWLSAGDVLFQRGNTREYVGTAAVFDGPEKSFVFPDLMIRVRFAESLSLRFIHTMLISPLLRKYFSVEATGASSSMPKISQGVLLNAPIPIPPLAEQHRIVAKVDELMALCDQLETCAGRAGDSLQPRLLAD
ncbi:MAG: restriction endonuclease subunit S, partial [Deltaproteobacteria bacterium]|nr:restriction endonuclease subunit S [Deltaproteobacteria bacterium]